MRRSTRAPEQLAPLPTEVRVNEDMPATPWGLRDVGDLTDLALVLRHLRRREARLRGGRQRSYRDLIERTGWSLGIIGSYLNGRILPPTDRFDELVRILGATPQERGELATARDRVEERRRRAVPSAVGGAPARLPADAGSLVGRESPSHACPSCCQLSRKRGAGDLPRPARNFGRALPTFYDANLRWAR